MKNLFLVCNAHLDPVWQWSEEEGIQAAISTFESAANLAEEFDYIFCHNEALLYSWIEKYAPELFAKIQRLVKQGKWRIMGGWYLQPDCNIPCGESLVRQILVGRRYFEEHFNAKPTVATNFDSFGHSIGLPQILKKTGYNAYVCCRPNVAECGIAEDDFIWVGLDGSEITVKRDSGQYSSALGHAADKINGHLNAYRDKETDGFVLWGVGNHGGGPSRKDLKDIEELIRKEQVNVLHSYPEEYFERGKRATKLKINTSLNRSMPGCYTSQVELKLSYRKLENSYFYAEKICACADMLGLFEYPFEELQKVEEMLLLCQFHDILPGTTVESAFKKAMNVIAHGQDVVDKIIFSAFNAYLSHAKRTDDGAYPVYAFNPSPYEREEVFPCEFMLSDQNWSDTETTFSSASANCQVVKEESNIPIDWRKRVLIQANLKPMSISVFELIPKRQNVREKLVKNAVGYTLTTQGYSFELTEGGEARVRFANGVEVERVSLCVYKDHHDSWIMQGELLNGFTDVLGNFRLATSEECKEFLDGTDLPIRLIENGEISDVIEVLYVYNRSFAVVKYLLNKKSGYIDAEINLSWQERICAVKLVIKTSAKGMLCTQTAYGEERYSRDGREYPMQKYCMIEGEESALAIINDGVYGCSSNEDSLSVTLARGACYCSHPIGDKQIVRLDRFNKGVDLGEHAYKFRIIATKDKEILHTVAQNFSEQPYVLSAFGRGEVQSFESAVVVDGKVELSSMRKNVTGEYVLRLFNGTANQVNANVNIPPLKLQTSVAFNGYEIKTLVVSKHGVKVVDEII